MKNEQIIYDSGSPFYRMILLILSVYVLTVLVLEALWVSDPEIKQVLQYIDFGICFIFLADFFVSFCRADSKLSYMKWGWIDFVSSIPAVDPLRWGRVTKVVRILRYLRAIKSIKILFQSVQASKFETLSLTVFLIVFLAFTLSAAFILEFERDYNSPIKTAEEALWWSFLNIMNAKTSIGQAMSPEGAIATTILNKCGLLIFAYFNSMVIAWLLSQKSRDLVED